MKNDKNEPQTAALPPDRYAWISDAFASETDRGFVLVAGGVIDDALGSLLKSACVVQGKLLDDVFEFNGPLGTFSARGKMACVLGLITPGAFRYIEIIRRIRNEMAHKPEPRSFDDPPICNWIDSARTVTDCAPPFCNADRKTKFWNNLITLLIVLESTAESVKPREPWPCSMEDSFMNQEERRDWHEKVRAVQSGKKQVRLWRDPSKTKTK